MFPGPGNGVRRARLGSQLPVCNRAFRAPGLEREHRDAKRLGAQRAEDLARIRWLSKGSVRVERSAARTLPCLAEGAPARGRWERDGAGEHGGDRGGARGLRR